MHLSGSILPATFFDHSVGLLARILFLLALLLIAPFLAGCRGSNPPAANSAVASATTSATITLSSDSLTNGTVPSEFTCDGADRSPPLKWTAPPAETKSFVLTVTDPDAPGGTFTHWILYDLPANTSALPAGVPAQDQLAEGSHQGRNDFAKTGYGGPCPPHGSTHRYFFDLFALNATLVLPASATRAEIEDAMNTHVLARGKLMARYSR